MFGLKGPNISAQGKRNDVSRGAPPWGTEQRTHLALKGRNKDVVSIEFSFRPCRDEESVFGPPRAALRGFTAALICYFADVNDNRVMFPEQRPIIFARCFAEQLTRTGEGGVGRAFVGEKDEPVAAARPRATPSGFSLNALHVTQGCATFVSLTSLHPGLT